MANGAEGLDLVTKTPAGDDALKPAPLGPPPGGPLDASTTGGGAPPSCCGAAASAGLPALALPPRVAMGGNPLEATAIGGTALDDVAMGASPLEAVASDPLT